MANRSRVPNTSPPKAADGDGNRIHNQILLQLPSREREMFFPKLELVRLQTNQLLHEAGDTIKSAYFVNAGLVSILCIFPDGKGVEVGLIGREGFVGLPLVAGFRTSATRAVAQIEGSAFRVDGEALTELLKKCPVLKVQLQQFSHIMTMEVSQIAACNRLHEVNERLARWLLMSADRLGSDSMALTHELLSQMLGTRRSSVTVAAGMLQKAGIITHTRGDVKIVDRAKLEETACECYQIMRRQIEEWRGEAEWRLPEVL